MTALHQVLCRMEEQLTGLGVDQKGRFGNHPLPLAEFLRGLAECGEPRGRFLDLGCGLGTKLLLAYYLGWPELVGVEINPDLAHEARGLVTEAEIIEADAFEFDCGGFDVVYTYRLCIDLDQQHDLGRHIARTADPGTLIFYAGADMPVGEQISERVWRI